MTIHEVEFAGAVVEPGGKQPGDLPQVAFSGRSNVGKSSLINRLLGRTRHKVARVSSSPGKTREINFYRVRASSSAGTGLDFFLVDLPGYGYAKVPVAVRGGWRPLIESYLSGSERLSGIVQLIDARTGPTAEDRKMIEFLAASGRPTLFVLTKMDKLKRSERDRQIGSITGALGLEPEQVVPFSAETGEGREELLQAVGSLLQDAK